MYYHLRFTPYELSSENLTTFCNKFDKYIIAHEQFKKDGITPTRPHYHCWIDSSMSRNGIRDAFKKALCIPSGGAGINNKYYSLEQYRKETDVCYIVKQGTIVSSKGVDEKDLQIKPCCKLEGNLKEKLQKPEAAPPAEKKEESKNSFWKIILEEAMVIQFREKRRIEIEEAIKLISRVYIKRMLPLPHPGDRKRWATSIVMYSKMAFAPEESTELEKVIEQEALDFIADHLIVKR